MNESQRIYEQIFHSLRSKGVEMLVDFIKEKGLDEYALNAIRTLASLPDPRVVTHHNRDSDRLLAFVWPSPR